MSPTILVTGGCGYIGTHTIVCLLAQGYNVVVVDNLVNANRISLDRVVEISGLTPEERAQRLVFHQVDVCDKEALRKVFETSPTFQACIHFAGLKVRLSLLLLLLLLNVLDEECENCVYDYYNGSLMNFLIVLKRLSERAPKSR
jgi:saccharopine dehydrogenase-like NADP-dependent oxidoreductase